MIQPVLMLLAGIDWRELFTPTVSLLELILRGTVMYLGIFFALRLFRRAAGAIGIADVLLVVLIADAAQNAMAGEYHSLTEGIVLVGTIIWWNFALDWLGYRVPAVRRLLEPAPLLLIENGRVLRSNLRAEMITIADLMEQLREHGVEQVAQVKRCYLEADGHLSVIKADGETEAPPATTRQQG